MLLELCSLLGLRSAMARSRRVFLLPSHPSVPVCVMLNPFHFTLCCGLGTLGILMSLWCCLPFPESHGDPGGGRRPVCASTQSSELSTPSSLYMEYGECIQPQRGLSLLVRLLHQLWWPQLLAPACEMLVGHSRVSSRSFHHMFVSCFSRLSPVHELGGGDVQKTLGRAVPHQLPL